MLLAAATMLIAAGPAQAVLVSATNGHLHSFTGGISQVNGALSAVGQPYGADAQTFSATYTGSGPGGMARGSFNVHWRPGQTVVYGAAFNLPSDFHAASAGQQALLRWDNSPGRGGQIEQGGVVIDYSDNQAYLVDAVVAGGVVNQRVLAGPFPVPIGGWFRLQVRQLLGSGSAAYSEVYENGQLVASSRAPTFAGRQITHVRFGIVQLSSDAELGPVTLGFDQASAGAYTGYVNPLGGDRYFTARTDMGVDFCLAPGEPIRAVGDAVVVGIDHNWFEHQPYLWYQLLDGPDAGRYVYVAEQIKGLARVGTELSAGQPLAYYKRSGTCIEVGWSASDGATWAQATTGYHEAQITRAGVNFARFLRSLGVQGPFELTPTRGKLTRRSAVCC